MQQGSTELPGSWTGALHTGGRWGKGLEWGKGKGGPGT